MSELGQNDPTKRFRIPVWTECDPDNYHTARLHHCAMAPGIYRHPANAHTCAQCATAPRVNLEA